MPFGGTSTIDDVTSGQRGGRVRRHDVPRRLLHPEPRPARSREALEAWHEKRDGKASSTYGFHIAVTDLADGRLARGAGDAARAGRHLVQALHGLQGRADGRRRDALQDDGGRGETGALVMVHAENGDAIDVLVKQALAAGNTEPAATRSPGRRSSRARRRTARSSSRASPARRSTSSTSPARRPSSRSRARASRAGTSGARPARSTSSSTTRTSSGRTSRARSTSTRRRRATKENQERALGRGALGRRSRRSRPTTARSCWTGRRRSARTTSRRSRTAARGSRTGCT